MAVSELEMLRELTARRRDVRRFRTGSVDENLLQEVFEIVEHSPSVGNSQPWRWVLVDSATLKEQVVRNFEAANNAAREGLPLGKRSLYQSLKLAGLKEAPVHYAVFCDTQTSQGSGLGRQSQPQTLHYSVVCAIMTFWLAATAKGLGVGWVSILKGSDVKTLLDVPAAWDFVAYLCVGHPQEEHYDPELQRFGWQERKWSYEDILNR